MESRGDRHSDIPPLATFRVMAVEIDFEPENGLCIYRITGRVTIDRMMALFARARAHEAWSDEYDFLTLLTRTSLSEMSASAMADLQARMAKADPVTTGPRRRAAIVCDDKLSRAMLAFWEKTSSQTLTTHERVFKTEHDARTWLAEPR
ncbi:STAS/SEC14 domain-containing protein [Maricaulis maris]|uniref:STAS/SEC14 domain-containing protein n=1 Tax=Maricaulis maris TaxID=74318 RepID=UPI003BAA0F01